MQPGEGRGQQARAHNGYFYTNSLASSQQTNETCDESPSNNTDESNRVYGCQQATDSSDPYHLYQVVVPEQLDSVGTRRPQFHDSGLSITSLRQPPAQHNQPLSPCRSIQRIVSSLFAANQIAGADQRQQLQLPPVPTRLTERSLVTAEPLIRPSSWQNKTLIDLRTQQSHAASLQTSAASYLESSLIQKTLPGGCGSRMRQADERIFYNPNQNSQLFQCQYQQPDSIYYENAPPARAPTIKSPEHHLIYSNAAAAAAAHLQYQPGNIYSLPPDHNRGSSSDSALGKTPSLLTRLCCFPSRAPSILSALFILLLLTLALVGGLILAGAKWQPNSEITTNTNTNVPFIQRAPFGLPTSPKMADERRVSVGTNELRPDSQMTNTSPDELLVSQTPPQPPSPQLERAQGMRQPSRPVIIGQLATGEPPQRLDPTSTQVAAIEISDSPVDHHWLWAKDESNERRMEDRQATCPRDCNQRGLCDSTNTCFCYAGFSGPTCSMADCPNDCSQHGECRLHNNWPSTRLGSESESRRGHLDSVGFASLTGSLAASSQCPSYRRADGELAPNRTALGPSAGSHDNRLEWRCHCEPGFTGADCSQARELQCDDKQDDDLDGLIDCEDDDCCSSAACHGSHLCFKSPDPIKVLKSSASRPAAAESGFRSKSAARFFARFSFLIGDDSVQSYARDSYIDWSRAAVIRGRVVKWRPAGSGTGDYEEPNAEGLASVRVSLADTPHSGITFTRADGNFELVVNGSVWITLQFNRHSYASIKRRVFVRAHSLQTLDSDVELWLAGDYRNQIAAGGAANSRQAAASAPTDSPFGLQLGAELSELANQMAKADDLRRASLIDCLMYQQQQQANGNNFASLYEPSFLLDEGQRRQQMQTFALVSSTNSYSAKLGAQVEHPIELIYNSAAFPPATSMAKTTIAVRLLPQTIGESEVAGNSHKLVAVNLQLDVEGQSIRKRLEPVPGLVYRFAWNRRDVYGQKVFGFSELKARIGYEYEVKPAIGTKLSAHFNGCLDAASRQANWSSDLAQPTERLRQIGGGLKTSRRLVWFERCVFMEAHPMNQQADVGRWNLVNLNRLDVDSWTLYTGHGRSIPLSLVYPPVVSPPIHLAPNSDETKETARDKTTNNRLMTRGPNSSIFVIIRQASPALGKLIQLDSSGRRRLMELPLSILAAKFSQQPARPGHAADLQMVYNNYLSTLYLSSRSAGKIVQISLASLLVLNKTLNGASATASAEDEIDIEPLCGFGRHTLGSSSPGEMLRSSRSVRLQAPHSMALDEERQILYFVEGNTNLVALDLASEQVIVLPIDRSKLRCRRAAGDENPGLSLYKPKQVHSLAWSKADSSLHFIDQNLVLALRPDLSLELVASGSLPPGLNAEFSLPTCKGSIESPPLGYIRTISVDERGANLLIAHEWSRQASAMGRAGQPPNKMDARLYLAKLRLGISESTRLGADQTDLFDLHSPESTWNPMIAMLMGGQTSAGRKNEGPWSAQINWTQLADRSQSTMEPVPFIHMSNGFQRIDSTEFNLDGSIFVLDSAADAIQLVVAHSAADSDRVEVNINRLFGSIGGQIEGAQATRSSALIVRNPLSNQLMEFHSASGIHLSSTFADGNKLDFLYKILTDRGEGNEDINQSPANEDDANDLDVQQLIRDYLMASKTTDDQVVRVDNTYVRLSMILDINGRRYEFVRSPSALGYAVQGILENHRPLIELQTDRSRSLSSYRHLSRGVSIELLYDESTGLLRDIIVSQQDRSNRAATRLKHVAYDKIYNHYCDLFTMES